MCHLHSQAQEGKTISPALRNRALISGMEPGSKSKHEPALLEDAVLSNGKCAVSRDVAS